MLETISRDVKNFTEKITTLLETIAREKRLYELKRESNDFEIDKLKAILGSTQHETNPSIYNAAITAKLKAYFDARNEEGNFIRSSLREMNALIASRFSKDMQSAIYPAPAFADVCFQNYCKRDYSRCFTAGARNTVFKQSKFGDYMQDSVKGEASTLALFGIINVSDNKPTTFPYINTFPLKQIEFDGVRKHVDEYKTFVTNKIEAVKTKWSAVDFSELIPNPNSKIPPAIDILIGKLDLFNASSLLGTLDYMQRFVTMMQTDNICPIQWDNAHDQGNDFNKLFEGYVDVRDPTLSLLDEERQRPAAAAAAVEAAAAAAAPFQASPGGTSPVVSSGSPSSPPGGGAPFGGGTLKRKRHDHPQAGGGVFYPAAAPELARWGVVIVFASGIGLMAARRAQRRRPDDLPHALLAMATGYTVSIALAATMLNLDPDAASGFDLVRVVLHLGAYWVAAAGTVAYARRSVPAPGSLEPFAAALTLAAMAAAVVI